MNATTRTILPHEQAATLTRASAGTAYSAKAPQTLRPPLPFLPRKQNMNTTPTRARIMCGVGTSRLGEAVQERSEPSRADVTTFAADTIDTELSAFT